MDKVNFKDILKEKEEKKEKAIKELEHLIKNSDFYLKIKDDLREILFLNNKEVLPILYLFVNEMQSFYYTLLNEIYNCLVLKKDYDVLENSLKELKNIVEDHLKEYDIKIEDAAFKLSYETQKAIINYLLRKIEILKEKKEGGKNG